MRFLKLAFAFTGTLMATIRAAPADAIQTSNEIPTEQSDSTQRLRCGDYYLIEEEEAVMPLYANGHYENVEGSVHMAVLFNLNCVFCIVFRERDAKGDVLWSGGPDPNGTQQVRGGQSYYCY
ncbi:hypothetical protein FB567DRAFT_318862 [Paraphoma chrysanthemicola]|uniref:Uncharacterized protein n=1 Tax=Paraphoma chrysanthemicola TaxID=798071 RepID=A0A8K0W040_9PLEO|nr:hypothetical protein FB567DRAFT_318862 [Paraphoma chrysanthemicola]